MSLSSGVYNWSLGAVQPQQIIKVDGATRTPYRIWFDNEWHSLTPTEKQVQLLQVNSNLELYTNSNYSFVLWFKPCIIQQGYENSQGEVFRFDTMTSITKNGYKDIITANSIESGNDLWFRGINSNNCIFTMPDLPEWNPTNIQVANGLFPYSGNWDKADVVINGVQSTVYNFISQKEFPNVDSVRGDNKNLILSNEVTYVTDPQWTFKKVPTEVSIVWQMLDPYTDPALNHAFSYINCGEPQLMLKYNAGGGTTTTYSCGYYFVLGVQYSPTAP